MTSSKKKFDFRKLKGFIPYVLVTLVTLGVVFFGSLDKVNGDASLDLGVISSNNYNISVDQLSELYVVADLSNAIGLASASDVAANYVVTSTMYDVGQTTTGKIEKPSITDIVVPRRVIQHVVAEGETMDSIAAYYGISTDQIRWSNGLKTKAITAGSTLYIPSTDGIVYTVKSSDTIESIAAKYGSNEKEIIALNDLEVSGISEGMRILIKGGTLPEKERPEYVPPVRTYTYTYTYSGSSAGRQNVRIIATGFYDSNYAYPNPNPGAPGWCTWYAWYWRASSPQSLGVLGHEGRNANTWHINYAYRGVGRTPVVGAVFQTPYGGGGYGHVGVVVGINGDGSITVREMNYAGRYVVTEGVIPASQVGNFNYIY